MRGWPAIPIGEALDGLFDGPHATPRPSSDGPVFLGIKNITEDGHLDLSEVRHISWEEFPRWVRRVEPRAGDLVFTYEASLHRYAIVPTGFKGCLGRRTALIRARPDRVDTRFLLYYFLGPQWRSDVGSRVNIGSTVDRIPLEAFPTFPVHLPPLPTQKKIASVLAAYDELIENNFRRIQLVEDMAATVYREWFEDRLFPGGGRDGEAVSLPEGWESVALFDAAEVSYGFAFKSALFNRGPAGDRVVRIRNIVSGTTRTFTTETAPLRYEVRDGDILIGMDGDFHIGVWADGRAMLNQRVARLRPRANLPVLYLFNAIRRPVIELNRSISGTTVAHLGDRHLRGVSVIVPPQDFLADTRRIFDPMLMLSRNLHQQIANLQATRNFLLPRLVSGQLDVSALDIDTEWLVA